MRNDDERVSAQTNGAAKLKYAKPALTEYGSVAKLTQSGGSTTTETLPMRRGSCL